MTLETLVHRAIDKVKADFSSNRDTQKKYLMNYTLKNYFSEDVPEEERRRLEGALEQKLDDAYGKYQDELKGVARKATSKGSMALAVANDISAYVSQVPIANVTAAGLALFGLKTAAEIPAMYRYAAKSHDWYGIGSHMLLKYPRYLIPVVGAALESGAFDRMVRKRIRKEAKDEFIKEFGDYVAFEDRLKEKLREPVREATYRKAA